MRRRKPSASVRQARNKPAQHGVDVEVGFGVMAGGLARVLANARQLGRKIDTVKKNLQSKKASQPSCDVREQLLI